MFLCFAELFSSNDEDCGDAGAEVAICGGHLVLPQCWDVRYVIFDVIIGWFG